VRAVFPDKCAISARGVTVNEQLIPADAWRRERAAALVKRLALAPGHRLHREQLRERYARVLKAGKLWSDWSRSTRPTRPGNAP
jgi:hypothetical protein